jgi:hypothetical protein
MKPSLLIAAGCSWVAGKYIDRDPTLTEVDYSYVEDPAFVAEHSFAGIIKRRLHIDEIKILANHGSSNQEQVRKILSFLEANQDSYSQIFVLWGVTSIYRWEVYDTRLDRPVACMVGKVYKDNPELTDEIKYNFKHHWDRDYELEKLGNQVASLSGYLKQQKIDHLFFNSFHSVTDTNLKIRSVTKANYYYVNDNNNDMLSFLCKENNVPLSKSSVPWLNLVKPSEDSQYHTPAVKELRRQGWLDLATAHPTVQAHQAIADELFRYIEDNKNERI